MITITFNRSLQIMMSKTAFKANVIRDSESEKNRRLLFIHAAVIV